LRRINDKLELLEQERKTLDDRSSKSLDRLKDTLLSDEALDIVRKHRPDLAQNLEKRLNKETPNSSDSNNP
jgi:hypothetical protein